MDTATASPIDTDRLNAFVGRFVGDLGATLHAGMVVIGEQLGLYRALSTGPMTSQQLARATATDERYVREWLASQAAGGYVCYSAPDGTFSLSPEQALTLAQEDSPAYLPGAFQLALGALKAVPRISAAFRSGEGMGWHEHDAGVFCGTEKFFRPSYAANLIGSWLPALDGVVEKLERGALVADVGCGHGSSTILMAQEFPRSLFVGFDYHAASVNAAQQRAEDAGVGARVRFEQAAAKTYPGRDYDLVTFFDCLHDMGDPAGAAEHVRASLKDDGHWMIVEPFAHDRLDDNLNPVGRVFYSASTLLCTPCSRSQEVALCLGAQAGEARLRSVVGEGGFKRFRRVAETPFNLVFEARH